jgi:hypothetical protein
MDRRTLESAAAKYSYLRGLLGIPAGLALIAAALGNNAVGPFAHNWFFVLVITVLGLVALAITRYYNDNYGRLNPTSRQQVRGAIAVAIGITTMVGGAFLLRDLPVNGIAVSFAALVLVTYAITVGLSPHQVIIWGAVLIAGALPVWNGDDPSNTGLVMAGVAAIACGVLDHRLFVRAFGPPTVAADAQA